jgi:GT2 family glycosyltransferase
MNRPDLTCIVTTYRSPAWLRLCLHALAADVRRLPGTRVELVVGDDGDDEHQSRAVVKEIAQLRVFESVRRFWQERSGFGKCRLANKAAAAAQAPLLLFLDGDCLVAPGALSAHLTLARPNRYVAGSPIRLGPRASAALRVADVQAGRHARPFFVLTQALAGEVESKSHYALLRLPGLTRLFRRTGRGGFNGGCTSVPAALLLQVNGWDESLGYGFEDTDLGHRLQNAGAQPVSARTEAMVVHLWHERGHRDPAVFERQRAAVAATLHGGIVRAEQGLAELGPHDAAVWDDPDSYSPD